MLRAPLEGWEVWVAGSWGGVSCVGVPWANGVWRVCVGTGRTAVKVLRPERVALRELVLVTPRAPVKIAEAVALCASKEAKERMPVDTVAPEIVPPESVTAPPVWLVAPRASVPPD